MLRDIFTNRWILGGFALLIIIAGACYFWYRHELAPYEKQAADSAEFVRELEKSQKAGTNSKAEQAADLTPTESTLPTAEKTTNETTEEPTEEIETDTVTETSQQSVMPVETAAVAEVSEFGYGPFPEVPQGFPTNIRIPWQWPDNTYSAGSELAVRVLIKLWNQGDTHFTGAWFTDDYKVYPHYPNTADVKYKEDTLEDGTVVKSITSLNGGPDLPEITESMMILGEIPGVQLISEEEGGIDALQFLNLE